MNASAVRMGRAFVEIGADATKLFKGLQQANARMGRFASGMRSLGSRMAGIGTAMAAPFAAAVMGGSRFEDVLLNMKASTGATAQQMDQVRSAAMNMSAALGVGPTEAASGFLELLKAGMSVEQVLGGAGESAIQFAKVGEMAVADAAVVMADAMAVFGVGGAEAANTLSAAADASSTSIPQIAQAFTQVSAVAGLANQSIGDTAAALAVLANAGVKGSDAGTSLKTMLLRLMSPVDDAAAALGELGLSTLSFRGADGRMRPMVEIIGTLNTAMAGLDQTAKDDIFRRIFGQDAIRAASILSTAGVDGMGAMQQSMRDALPVSAKFAEIMSGLSGVGSRLLAALERLAVAISEALGPSLVQIGTTLTGLVSGFADFVTKNQALVVAVAQGIAIFTAAGVALYGLGAALGVVSTVIGLVLNPFIAIPALIAAAVGAVLYFTGTFEGLGTIVSTTLGGVYEAIVAGDLAGAMGILWLGLQAGWLRGVANFMGVFEPWIDTMANTFSYLSANVLSIWDGMLNAMAAAWDLMEGNVRKGWNYLQTAFKGADAVAIADNDINREMEKRKQERQAGVRDRTAEADKAAADRLSQSTAGDYRKAADAAQAEMGNRIAAGDQAKTYGKMAAELLADIEKATTIDQLGYLYDKFDAMSSAGRLSDAQSTAIEEALADAQVRIQKASQPAGTGAGITAGAGAGGVGTSQAEVAGSFSARAIGGMGAGSSLAQKQVDLLGQIADNTAQENGVAP